MENPIPPKPPENPTAEDSLKLRLAREAELKRSREIGHLLKSKSFHPHAPPRRMPHVRGR
ncbi:MAG TPA: hypothetical protein VMD31_10930 [Opitutaceae bacterium]|nr:hypothetical protein [Opitutaceae bacterium]